MMFTEAVPYSGWTIPAGTSAATDPGKVPEEVSWNTDGKGL